MKKVFKQLFFSVMCMMALATIASCDKDSNSTGSGTPGGGGITPAGYVDLGLPSGTLWKNQNETNPNDSYDFYTYDEAVQQFGDQLPTKEQFKELKENCTYVWDESARGCWFYGPNGNRIFLPAAGGRGCAGDVGGVGSTGLYWSATPFGSVHAWYLYFNSGEVDMNYNYRCFGLSVRLVQD